MQWDEIISYERQEGFKEGREEGREVGLYDAVDKLVANGVYDVEKACEILGVELDSYNEYLADRG